MALSLFGRFAAVRATATSAPSSLLLRRSYAAAAAAAAASTPRSVPELMKEADSLHERISSGEVPTADMERFTEEVQAAINQVSANSVLLGNKSAADLAKTESGSSKDVGDLIVEYGDIELSKGENVASALSSLQNAISDAEGRDPIGHLLQAGHITLGKDYSPMKPPQIDFDHWRKVLSDNAVVDQVEAHYKMFQESVCPPLEVSKEFAQLDKLYEKEFAALRERAVAAKQSADEALQQVKISEQEALTLKDEMVQTLLDEDPQFEKQLEQNLLAGRWDPEEGEEEGAGAPKSAPSKVDLFWDAYGERTEADAQRPNSVDPDLEKKSAQVAGF